MRTGQNDYEEGVIDIFAGPSALGECYNFDLGTLGTNDDISKPFLLEFQSQSTLGLKTFLL